MSGGEGGIRTHVPLRTRRFRGAPVTTTSVPLRSEWTGKVAGTFNYITLDATLRLGMRFRTLTLEAFIAFAQPTPPQTPAVPATLTVPDGFVISVFASGLNRARLMAVSPEGILVVAQRANVVALPDANGDGKAEPKVLLTDQPYAHSVAFANGYLYIATTPAILRVRWSNGTISGAPETIAELPSSKPSLHGSRTMRMGPDGRLYVAMGSSCNFCVEPDPRRKIGRASCRER